MTESLDSWSGNIRLVSRIRSGSYFTYDSQGESPVVSFEINHPSDQTITVDGIAAETARYNAIMVVRDGHNDDLAVAPDGKHVLFTRMSVAFPNEIYSSIRCSTSTIGELHGHIAPKQFKSPK